MKQKLYIFLLVFTHVLASLPLLAQTPFHVWVNRFPNSNYSSGPASVEITYDGGFLTAGNVSAQAALNISKFSSTGVLEWSKDYGPAYGCAAFAAIQLKDTGYAACGIATTGGSGPSGWDIYVVRTDKNGTLLWSRTYTGIGSSGEAGNWIHQTLDGGLIIGGNANNSSGYNWGLLIKTDINGTTEWSKTYTYSAGSTHLYIDKGVQLSDSSFVLGGKAGYGVILFKTDKKGVFQWAKEYRLPSSVHSYSFNMRKTRDKGFIMVGTSTSPTWYAFKVDSAGGLEWSKNYKHTFNNPYGYCYDVEELDYGYAMVGYFYDVPPSYSTSYLLKTDPSGNLLWNKTFNEQYWDWLFSVKQTADKGLVMWGHTQIVGSQQRGSLIKTDSLGEGTCKFSSQTMIVTNYTPTIITPAISTGSGANSANSTNTYVGSPVIQTFPCDSIPDARFTANDTVICAGGSVSFTDQSTGTPNLWNWSFEGGTPANSALKNPVVTYSAAGSYYVKLVVSNGLGTDSVVKTSYITVQSSTEAGSVVGVPDTLCSGEGTQLTVAGYSGNIQWQSSGNGISFTDIPGASSSVLDTPQLTNTIYYRVTSFGGCGTDSSNTVQIVVNPLPALSLFTADTLICSGDSTGICTNVSFPAYLWNTGDTSSCVYARNPGGYIVTVTDANGCTNTSREDISVYPVSSVSIVVQGDTLSSFNAVSYQWYFNDQIIPGATNAVYIVQQSGVYALEITDANGCRARSNSFNIFRSGLESSLADGGPSVFPNPFTQTVFVQGDGISSIEVYDPVGRIVHRENSRIWNTPAQVNLSLLRAGIYFLHIEMGSMRYIRRIVKE